MIQQKTALINGITGQDGWTQRDAHLGQVLASFPHLVLALVFGSVAHAQQQHLSAQPTPIFNFDPQAKYLK